MIPGNFGSKLKSYALDKGKDKLETELGSTLDQYSEAAGVGKFAPLGNVNKVSIDNAGKKESSAKLGNEPEDVITDEDIEVAEREADAYEENLRIKEAEVIKRVRAKPKHKNPLERFASVNHLWSLGALSTEEVNFPKTSYRMFGIRDSQLVIRAGGLGDARDKKQKTAGEIDNQISTEYFIDNIDIKHVVAPDKRTRATNALTIDFEVIEPYSMGQFLQSLQLAAMKAGFKNYIDAPYLLEYKAVGYRDITAVSAPQADTVYTKYIPIKFTDVTFEVKEGGSTYVVTAIPFNEEALTDENQSLPVDVEISGYDLEQILQSGLNSLATQINTHLINQAKEAKNPVEPDEVMITFPTHFAAYNFGNVASSADDTALKGDALTIKEPSELDINGAIESIGGAGFGMFQAEGYEQEAFGPPVNEQMENFVKSRTGYSIKRNNLSETLKKQFVNTGANVNYIGKTRILSDDPLSTGNANFTVSTFAYDTTNKIFKKGRTQIDPSQRTINFTKGTKIQRIIEEIVTLSDFGKRLSVDGPKADEFGFVNWFRIQTQVYILDSPEAESVNGRSPRIFVYQVKPYRVHSSTFLMPNDAPYGYNIMRAMAEKEYNYIYTGVNKDVLNFDIDFKTAFYRSIQGDAGNRSGNNDLASTGKNIPKEENSKQGDQNAFVGSNPARAREIGVISETEAGNRSGGAFTETPAVRVARAFQDALVNSKEDLVSATLTIMGDPYFVCDNGLGNYNTEAEDLISIDRYGNMNYENGQVDIIINFRTPIDLGQNFDGTNDLVDTKFGTVPQFSGLYFIVTALSSWRNGQFTQELNVTRRPNQDESYAELNKKQVQLTLDTKRRRQAAINAAIKSGDPEAIARAQSDLNGDGRINPSEKQAFESILATETEKVKARDKRRRAAVLQSAIEQEQNYLEASGANQVKPPTAGGITNRQRDALAGRGEFSNTNTTPGVPR